MAEQVEIRLDGDAGSALRAIEEVKAALATLTDKTVQVRVAQDRAAASSRKMADAEENVAQATRKATTEKVKRREADLRAADLEQRLIVTRQKAVKATEDEARAIIADNEARARGILQRQSEFRAMQQVAVQRSRNDDMLRRSSARLAADRQKLDQIVADGAKRWEAIESGRAAATESAERRIRRATSGGGGGGSFGRSSRFFRNVSGIDTGGAGLRLRTVGILGGVAGVTGLIKPLTDVLGLVGAIPAAMGAAGLAFASFKAIGAAAMEKAVKDQQTAQDKFKAGTITAKAYSNAMKNATIGLSAEQKKALPFFEQWRGIIQDTSERIRSKMLPALGALSQGLKANRSEIARAFGGGAGIVAGGLRQLGGFLSSGSGKRGVSALLGSSQDMLGGLTQGAVNLFRSVLSIATAARPLVNALAADFTRLTSQFAAWSHSFTGQQALKKWFSDAEVSSGKFLRVLYNVGHAIQNIGGGIGTGFLDWLVKVTAKFEQWTANSKNTDRLAASVKRIADTLLVVASAVARVAPAMASFGDTLTKTLGPNSLGYLLLGRVAFKGAAGLASFGGGLAGMAGKLFGRGAAPAAARGVGPLSSAAGVGVGSGGVLAGMGLSAAALTGAAVGLGLVAAAVVGIIVLTRNHKKQADDVSRAWDNVNSAVRRTAGSMNLAQNAATQQRARLAALPGMSADVHSAHLAAFDARAQLSADKAALPGLRGAAKQRMEIQISVDTDAVKQAEHELQHLRNELNNARNAAKRHADDSREANRTYEDSTKSATTALEKATDAAAKNNAEVAKNPHATGLVKNGVDAFIASMNNSAKALAAADPKAAAYAKKAALLAANLHKIPTSIQVNIALHGQDQIAAGVAHIQGLLNSIHDKSVRVLVTQSVTSINPNGRPAPVPVNPNGKPKGSFTGGKISTPTAIVGEQGAAHPEFVIATNPQYRERNKGLVSQAAHALGGQVQFYQQGGVIQNPRGGWWGYQNPTGPPLSNHGSGGGGGPAFLSGTSGALGWSNGDSALAGTAKAQEYARIPGQISALKATMVRIHHQLAKDAKFISHEKNIAFHFQDLARHEKDRNKKLHLQDQAREITRHTIPRRKGIMKGRQGILKADQKTVDKLTAELADLVPGEQGFQDMVAAIEGQMAAAQYLGKPKDAAALRNAEIRDYKSRLAFLIAFTGAKSTIRNRPLFSAASAALGSDKGALDAILGDSGGTPSGGSGSSGDTGANDQALAMLAELSDFAKQGRLSDLIGADELKTTMAYISKTVGSFAKGSPFIAKSGLAMVHQGEAIIPASQNPYRASGGGGTMTGVLTLEGSDDLTRALAKALGPQVNVEMGRDSRRRRREGAYV